MKYDGRKIANSFYLPKHPTLSGIASLIDITGSQRKRLERQIMQRSDAEAMRLDWEAVGQSLWWAIGEYDRQLKENGLK